MRTFILSCLLLSTPALADQGADNHENKAVVTAPVEQTAAGDVYGVRMPDPMPAAVGIDEAANNIAAHVGKPAAFSGRVTEVCQNSGCWVVLAGENGRYARVNMHDHSFGVPKDTSGPAIVYGTLTEKKLNADEIEHLRKEGSKPRKVELQIDAVSVLIPKAV